MPPLRYDALHSNTASTLSQKETGKKSDIPKFAISVCIPTDTLPVSLSTHQKRCSPAPVVIAPDEGRAQIPSPLS